MTSYDSLLRQLHHVIWSDEAGLAAAATVPAGRLGENFGFSFGSVHATLVHMLGAQLIWLDRLTSKTDPSFPSPADLPTLDDVRQRWAGLHASWRQFLAGQTDESIGQEVIFLRRGQQYRTTVRIVLGHVFDHATHHRGQLNSLIKLAGGTPGNYGQIYWSGLTGETKEL